MENRNCFYLSRVNKFMRRSLLLRNREHYLPGIQFGEDNLWTIPGVLGAESLYVFANWYPYAYRFNPGSINHTWRKNLWASFLLLGEKEKSVLRAYGHEEMIPQVEADTVMHAAISVNNVMRGTFGPRESIRQIREIIRSPELRQGLTRMNPAVCSRTERLNFRLMRAGLAGTIYLAKRIQGKAKMSH